MFISMPSVITCLSGTSGIYSHKLQPSPAQPSQASQAFSDTTLSLLQSNNLGPENEPDKVLGEFLTILGRQEAEVCVSIVDHIA